MWPRSCSGGSVPWPRHTTIGVAQISQSAIQQMSSSWCQGVIFAASHSGHPSSNARSSVTARIVRWPDDPIGPRTVGESGVKFVGSFHGKCYLDGSLEGSAEKDVIERHRRAVAGLHLASDVASPKQQAWVGRHKHLIRHGVIFTVGFAFDVNAGMKPDAPLWMQRYGLTWIFRLWSEPRRLGPRYLRYNFLFLWYLLLDGLRGRAWRTVS